MEDKVVLRPVALPAHNFSTQGCQRSPQILIPLMSETDKDSTGVVAIAFPTVGYYSCCSSQISHINVHYKASPYAMV